MLILQRHKLFLIAAMPLATVFGLASGYRFFGEGRDYLSYYYFFQDLRIDDALDFFRFENGFVLTAIAAKFWLHLEYGAFAAILMTVALVIKLRVLGQLAHPFLALLFYLANWYPLLEYTQIRLAMAVALLFLAVNTLYQGRWSLFFGLCLLASTFHATALFASGMLVLAWVASKYSLWVGVLIIGITILATKILIITALSLFVQLNPLVTHYVLNAQEYDAPNAFSAANLLTLLFLVQISLSEKLVHFIGRAGEEDAFARGMGILVWQPTLRDRRRRTLFLVCLAAMGVFYGFIDLPVFAHRLKEVLLVFMTLLAFDSRISRRTLPSAVTAFVLSVGVLYATISSGIIGAN